MGNFSELISIDQISVLFDAESTLYLFVILLVFYLGKKVHDLRTPFDLNAQLIEEDNKAVALAFTGYLFALGLVLWGVLSSPDTKSSLLGNLTETIVWGIIGIVLLQISRIISDRVIFSQFDIDKELVTDRNAGTGAALCGAYVGVGLIISAVIFDDGSGEVPSFMQDFVNTLIFFALGQVAFVVFAKIYQKITRYDLYEEIEKDNVSAGVAFGMTIAAVGILLSGFIIRSSSIPGLITWFIIGGVQILIFRYLIDKLILPGALLDEEISKDQNWGAALIEGGSAIIIALLLNAAYLNDLVF